MAAVSDGWARGRSLRIAGTGVLVLYLVDLLVLGSVGGVWDGAAGVAEAAGVSLGMGVLALLGWRRPGVIGGLLLGVGLILLVVMAWALTAELLGGSLLTANGKRVVVLLLAPPSVAGATLVAASRRASR